MHPALRNVAAALSAILVAACASGPGLDRAVTIQDGQPVTVVYEQRQSAFKQTLLTEGVVDAKTFYSSESSDPLAKIMSTAQMQVMLDALATYGFFAHAHAGDDPGAVSQLRVTLDGHEQVWSKTASMSIDELGQYHQAMKAFLDLWNNTESFHVGRGDNSVLDEAERIRRRNEAALRKAESTKGRS